ncbi:MAG: phosphate ABC transporter permease subunit PstC [Dehalococcoidia bacterium]|nr:phosphate ABC transporter permease subunit PstC [Dehalococcoidia bacterium]
MPKISRQMMDVLSRRGVFLTALAAILIVFLIGLFVIQQGIPAFRAIGVFDFLFGTVWRPGINEFGILPMMVGSIYVTIGALLLSAPLGIACAIFLAEVAPYRVRGMVRSAVELLVGIPSVVYGLVGMVILVPLIREIGGNGYSVLAGVIVLTIMVLPTVVSISEDSIRAVPVSYREGALASGANHWQTIWHVILPAARSGIMAAVILAMGRAIGETMAMIMVIGNSILIPTSPLDPARTLTGNIAVEIMYAGGLHESALFATGIVLFLLIMGLNSLAFVARRRM